MSDSTKPPMNKKLIYVFIVTSMAISLWFLNNHATLIPYIGIAIPPLKWFFIFLFVLWFNKYISGKIKQLFGLKLERGMLSVTRTIEEPGTYNVFSDFITGISNGFMYIVQLKFLGQLVDDE
jgi:hypothetical protein